MDSSRFAISDFSVGMSKIPLELAQALPQSVGIQIREVGSIGFGHEVGGGNERWPVMASRKEGLKILPSCGYDNLTE